MLKMADHILLHCKRSTAVIFSLKFSWERSSNISECGECVLDTSRPVSLQAVCRCRHMLWCVRLFSQQASASLTYSCRVTPSSSSPLLPPSSWRLLSAADIQAVWLVTLPESLRPQFTLTVGRAGENMNIHNCCLHQNDDQTNGDYYI